MLLSIRKRQFPLHGVSSLFPMCAPMAVLQRCKLHMPASSGWLLAIASGSLPPWVSSVVRFSIDGCCRLWISFGLVLLDP